MNSMRAAIFDAPGLPLRLDEVDAPTAGEGATCRSCANCPWMAMNDLERLAAVFDRPDNEIKVDPSLGAEALRPLDRMLAFAAELNNGVVGRA